tara:strand:+ start:553 stop:783 length:231 start_codon:yes stop_codon:yes gene_type:complete
MSKDNTPEDWAQLEALLTAAHEAGRAVGHGRTKIITDYPNLSKHYARYTTEAIKTFQEFPEENDDERRQEEYDFNE